VYSARVVGAVPPPAVGNAEPRRHRPPVVPEALVVFLSLRALFAQSLDFSCEPIPFCAQFRGRGKSRPPHESGLAVAARRRARNVHARDPVVRLARARRAGVAVDEWRRPISQTVKSSSYVGSSSTGALGGTRDVRGRAGERFLLRPVAWAARFRNRWPLRAGLTERQGRAGDRAPSPPWAAIGSSRRCPPCARTSANPASACRRVT
jgi:hypothetical protein